MESSRRSFLKGVGSLLGIAGAAKILSHQEIVDAIQTPVEKPEPARVYVGRSTSASAGAFIYPSKYSTDTNADEYPVSEGQVQYNTAAGRLEIWHSGGWCEIANGTVVKPRPFPTWAI